MSSSSPRVGTIEEYIAALKASPIFGPQVVHHEELPPHPSSFADPATALPGKLQTAISRFGVDRLYSHQAQAIDVVRQGRDVIVATPTASGKSLIYNIPVFETIMQAPGSRALYLFPLKALAQDQLKAVDKLAAGLPQSDRPAAVICDGDTSDYMRRKIRDHLPDILITNPDMLHLSMLGYHDRWTGLWESLTHIIIDEVHSYRGVFGSHMAWVLRRLQRICAYYGSRPRFILSSATIGNPAKLAGDLLDREVEVITNTGAPRGGKHFVFFNPFDSASYAASQMLEAALKRGLRTIVYTQSRKMTELISIWTQQRLGDLKDKLTAYRAGFLPEERREIEQKLSSGELYGVISTSALELGIDIGELDLCILVGYPGTIMATWQRGGRVGRRQRDSLIVMIAQEDALDQHYMRNPLDFFERDVESAVLNPGNTEIMKRHLACTAAERYLAAGEPLLANRAVRECVRELEAEGLLLRGADGESWYPVRKYPHREVDLRGSGRSYTIKSENGNEIIGRIDGVRCLKECHPGAVYLHRGRTWLVRNLDLDGHEVTVRRQEVNYFTRPLADKETEILQIHDSKYPQLRGRQLGFKVSFGRLRVTDRVTGFQKRLVRGHKLIATEKLDLPPMVFETEGLWLEIPPEIEKIMEKEQRHFMGGIHAVEHGMIGIFPLLVLCDRNDVGGIAYPFHPQLQTPAVFIYDGHPGGVGLNREAYGQVEELLELTGKTIATCCCEIGCPSCVHSPKCGSGNRPIDKEAAIFVLDSLLSMTRVEVEDPGPPPIPDDPFLNPPQVECVGETKVEIEVAVQSPAAVEFALPERYGVFDVETKRSAQEVGGWHRAERMGISAAVVYDAGKDRFFHYLEDEIPGLVAHLQKLDLVIGFNNKRFDNRVLSAYTNFDLGSLPTMDLLEEVKNRLGYRLSLDRLAEHTLGVKKSADGLMALKWYKEGRIDEIVEYCQKDVEITRDIFLFAVENRYLLFKNKAGAVVRCPLKLTMP